MGDAISNMYAGFGYASKRKPNKSADWLSYLGSASKNQYKTGMGDYGTKLRSTMLNDIDTRFDEAGRTSDEAIAQAGLGASGLGTVARMKLAEQRGNAVAKADTQIASMDWNAKQQGLHNLFNVQSGYQRISDQAQQQRQFEQQLKFQKEQAEYGWGDFFGDLLGAGAKVGSAAISASDRKLKENIKVVGRKGGIEIVQFNYKKYPSKRYEGVIAQDIQSKYPDAVVTSKDGYLAVNYDKIPVDFKEVTNE